MADDGVTLEFLAKLVQRSIEESRQIRKELLELKQLHVSHYEMTRRLDRRMNELRDDVEVMIKMELGGALANMQTAIESSLGRLENKYDDLAGRVGELERKL